MDAARAPLSEAEFEEIMNRNRAISSSAISRAVSDASAGKHTHTCRSYSAYMKVEIVYSDVYMQTSQKECIGSDIKVGGQWGQTPLD